MKHLDSIHTDLQARTGIVQLRSTGNLNPPFADTVLRSQAFSQKFGNRIRPLRTLSTIINSFSDLSIWAVDRQLVITAVNEHFRNQYHRHWGVNIQKGDSIRKAISATPEQRDQWRALFSRCLNGEHIRIEVELMGRLHEIDMKPLLFKGVVDEIVCFCTDITDKRQQEQNEAYERERWKIAVEGNEFGLWDLDIRKNELYFSPSCYQLLGFSVEDNFSGSVEDWTARIHPEDRQKSGRNLLELLSGLRDSFKTEIRVRCKNGEYKWMLDQGKAYGKDANGYPTNIIGLMKDISEGKTAELQVQQYLKSLEHFAYLTSHSLRLPVSNILGLTSMLEENGNKEDLVRIAQYLKTSALKLDEVIREMNDAITYMHKEKELPATHQIERVWFVDDDPINNLLSEKMLESTFPEIQGEQFEQPEEALHRLLSQTGDQPDALFLDLNMPEMDGWDFLDALVTANIRIPVFILSSSIDPKDQQRATKYPNVRDFISKPLRAERLRIVFKNHDSP
jgi:PAS domain S-box-containing protein